MLLDLSRNSLVVLVLLSTVSVGKSRRVEDANLESMSNILTIVNIAGTHHSAVLACKFVKAGRGRPTQVVRSTLLVGMVEDVEVVVINLVPSEDIGDKLQDGGFPDTSFPNKKDGGWRFRLVV